MKIMSINSSRNYVPVSKGHLTIYNCETNKSKTLLTNAIQDSTLATNIKSTVPFSFGKTISGAKTITKNHIKNLINSIDEVTNENFTNLLPKIEKDSYTIYNIESDKKSLLNIKGKFVLYHDEQI